MSHYDDIHELAKKEGLHPLIADAVQSVSKAVQNAENDDEAAKHATSLLLFLRKFSPDTMEKSSLSLPDGELEKTDDDGWEAHLKTVMQKNDRYYFGSLEKHYHGAMGSGHPVGGPTADMRGYPPKQVPHSPAVRQAVHGRGTGVRTLTEMISAIGESLHVHGFPELTNRTKSSGQTENVKELPAELVENIKDYVKKNGKLPTRDEIRDNPSKWDHEALLELMDGIGLSSATREDSVQVVDQEDGEEGKTKRRLKDGTGVAEQRERGAGENLSTEDAMDTVLEVFGDNKKIERATGKKPKVIDDANTLGTNSRHGPKQDGPRTSAGQKHKVVYDEQGLSEASGGKKGKRGYGNYDPKGDLKNQPEMNDLKEKVQRAAQKEKLKAKRALTPKRKKKPKALDNISSIRDLKTMFGGKPSSDKAPSLPKPKPVFEGKPKKPAGVPSGGKTPASDSTTNFLNNQHSDSLLSNLKNMDATVNGLSESEKKEVPGEFLHLMNEVENTINAGEITPDLQTTAAEARKSLWESDLSDAVHFKLGQTLNGMDQAIKFALEDKDYTDAQIDMANLLGVTPDKVNPDGSVEANINDKGKKPSGKDGIPDYSDVKLSNPVNAGGSNDAKIYTDEDGKKWLVKSYGGNKDRVANELVANALYRKMGHNVPEAGIRKDGDKISLAYPLMEGKSKKITSKSKELGEGFVTDAVLANWDVVGLNDDNILWDKDGKPIRIDQGGALAFRAQGDKKPFTEEVKELQSMILDPKGQAYDTMEVTGQMIAQQAQDILDTLTPDVVDEVFDSVEWGDDKLKDDTKSTLKARIKNLIPVAEKLKDFDEGDDEGTAGSPAVPKSPKSPDTNVSSSKKPSKPNLPAEVQALKDEAKEVLDSFSGKTGASWDYFRQIMKDPKKYDAKTFEKYGYLDHKSENVKAAAEKVQAFGEAYKKHAAERAKANLKRKIARAKKSPAVQALPENVEDQKKAYSDLVRQDAELKARKKMLQVRDKDVPEKLESDIKRLGIQRQKVRTYLKGEGVSEKELKSLTDKAQKPISRAANKKVRNYLLEKRAAKLKSIPNSQLEDYAAEQLAHLYGIALNMQDYAEENASTEQMLQGNVSYPAGMQESFNTSAANIEAVEAALQSRLNLSKKKVAEMHEEAMLQAVKDAGWLANQSEEQKASVAKGLEATKPTQKPITETQRQSISSWQGNSAQYQQAQRKHAAGMPYSERDLRMSDKFREMINEMGRLKESIGLVRYTGSHPMGLNTDDVAEMLKTIDSGDMYKAHDAGFFAGSHHPNGWRGASSRSFRINATVHNGNKVLDFSHQNPKAGYNPSEREVVVQNGYTAVVTGYEKVSKGYKDQTVLQVHIFPNDGMASAWVAQQKKLKDAADKDKKRAAKSKKNVKATRKKIKEIKEKNNEE